MSHRRGRYSAPGNCPWRPFVPGRSWPIRSIILWTIFFPAVAIGQGVEIEPNHPCQLAQDLRGSAPPLTFFGNLDSTPESPDVDFYLFSAPPGELLQVDLEGDSTGVGSLTDPYLGLFDVRCNLLEVNDDGGTGLNSRLFVSVAEDGHFVLGVSRCCDFDFIGGGVGSYRLSVALFQSVASISGRLVDAASGQALPGGGPPFPFVVLNRCSGFGCFEFVGFQVPDSEGRFHFSEPDFFLSPGSYRVDAFAHLYDPAETGPFEAAPNENVDLGDIALEPIRLIGSIRGRLVDSLSGQPIAGRLDSSPFPFVHLLQCDETGCFIVTTSIVDEQGNFQFDGTLHLLRVGTYALQAMADQYEPADSQPFEVGEGEHFDFGDFPMIPLPIQLLNVKSCERIPSTGGACLYGVTVRNGSSQRFKGQVWSLVDAFAIGSPTHFSRFQVGRQGPSAPLPQPLNLRPGEGAGVQFQFDVPEFVQDGALICVSALVGPEKAPQFLTLGNRQLFCVVKFGDSFVTMSDKEARPKLQELRRKHGQ